MAMVAGLLLTSRVLAFPAHYFVIKETADGCLAVVFHQAVELSGVPASTALPVPPNGIESYLAVAVQEKASGKSAFTTVVAGSAWERGEFRGKKGIEGKSRPAAERLYVVRVPVAAGTLMRLVVERGPATPAVSASPQDGSAAKSRLILEIDLDAYSAPLANAVPLPAPGPATGSTQ